MKSDSVQVLNGRSGGCDALAQVEVVDGGNVDFASLQPGQAFTIGGNGNLINGAGAILAGQYFVEASR